MISEATRPITTTTIREAVYWADSSRVIRYRLDRLEERNLIKTHRDEERGESQQMAPRVAVTTDAGANIAAEYDDNPETLPVEERLARIEEQHKRMRETYVEAKGRIVEMEESIDELNDDIKELDEDVEGLAEKIRNVQRFLDFSGG